MTKRKPVSAVSAVAVTLTGVKLRDVLAVVAGNRGDRKYFGECYVAIPYSEAKGLDAVKAVEAARV